MSNPPSRSEIESALSGRTKKTKPPQTRKPSPELDFNEPPRRQQVIGGNLSGVNKRKKFGIFSRYSDVSIANWIAGFVVLLIVVAFFWPHKEDTVTEVAKKLEENRIIAVEDQELEQTTAGVSSFARETDSGRANEYREIDATEKKIRDLLQVADNHISKREFTEPNDQNAVTVYKQILELNPNNPAANEGLEKIRRHFLVRGIRALEDDKDAVATSNLARLAIIDRSSIEFEDLELAIDAYKIQQEIAATLQKAQLATKSGNLILPARESALSFYQQVLRLDETNEVAQQGIKTIADSFIDQANTSVLTGDFGAAAAQLATVALIDPEHKSIPLIEAMISRAKPLVEAAAQQESIAAVEPPTEEVLPVESTQSSTDQGTDNPSRVQPTQVGDGRTSEKQTSEQEALDKQYLQQGLDAYYSGDYAKAAALLQPLADKGIARAQMRLAYMHFLGRGFQRGRAQADRIVRSSLPAIRKFANEGRGWAQSDLGSLYEDGLVLPRDYGEAVYWYRTAAEKGYPGAQTNLGLMYARGRGVANSRRTAIEWFQRAAKQGDEVAKRNLEALGVD